jgi:hypothetical protein
MFLSSIKYSKEDHELFKFRLPNLIFSSAIDYVEGNVLLVAKYRWLNHIYNWIIVTPIIKDSATLRIDSITHNWWLFFVENSWVLK